jgi:hypothetical protein
MYLSGANNLNKYMTPFNQLIADIKSRTHPTSLLAKAQSMRADVQLSEREFTIIKSFLN